MDKSDCLSEIGIALNVDDPKRISATIAFCEDKIGKHWYVRKLLESKELFGIDKELLERTISIGNRFIDHLNRLSVSKIEEIHHFSASDLIPSDPPTESEQRFHKHFLGFHIRSHLDSMEKWLNDHPEDGRKLRQERLRDIDPPYEHLFFIWQSCNAHPPNIDNAENADYMAWFAFHVLQLFGIESLNPGTPRFKTDRFEKTHDGPLKDKAMTYLIENTANPNLDLP